MVGKGGVVPTTRGRSGGDRPEVARIPGGGKRCFSKNSLRKGG